MAAFSELGMRWIAILRRTISRIDEDDCLGLAAQLAFYFQLAVFPALLFVAAMIGYLPVENVLDELLSALAPVAPGQLLELFRSQLDQLATSPHGGVLTLGFGGSVWSSSAAIVALIGALNRVYRVAEWRSWWKRRLVALGLTLLLALFITVSLVFVIVSPNVATRAVRQFGLAPAVGVVWRLARWPVMILCGTIGIDIVYHFAPNRPKRWSWMTPGSLVATSLWIASSFAFKFYVTYFGNYSATYGAIGGAIVTIMWFYVSGLAILAGAEVNGVIDSASRDGESGPVPEAPRLP